jgi:hypothetical protein
MLEIYSEVVRDLLNSKADRKSGLNIREDPKIGFYRNIRIPILRNIIILNRYFIFLLNSTRITKDIGW